MPSNAQIVAHNAGELRLSANGNAVAVDTEVFDTVGSTNVPPALVLRPSLDAGSDVVLSSECPACIDGPRTFRWSVAADVDETAPVFQPGPLLANVCALPEGVRVGLDLPTFDEEEFLLRIQSTNVDVFLPSPIAPDFPAASFRVNAADADFCFDVTAVDVAGNGTRLADALCVRLEAAAECDG